MRTVLARTALGLGTALGTLLCVGVLTVALGSRAAGGGDSAAGTAPAAPQVAAPAVAAGPVAAGALAVPDHPSTAPDECRTSRAAQRIIVDISEQHAWFCSRGATAWQSPVTTGAVALSSDDATPLGTYRIQGRNRHTVLTLADGSTYAVAYWVPFEAPLYGFHDSPWQTFDYGSALYRTEGSHGCVHLPAAAMKHLYNWVQIGATVTIRA